MANADFLHERLPVSRLAVVDAGHFVWEGAAAEYGSLVSDRTTGGYRAWCEPGPTGRPRHTVRTAARLGAVPVGPVG